MKSRCNIERWVILPFLIIWSMPLGPAKAQEDVSLLKAICIERFTKFIDWPANLNNSGTIKLGFYGDYEDPIKPELEKVYKKITIKGQKVELIHIKSISDLKKQAFAIIFISNSSSHKIDEILKYTHDKPILTLSDSEGFCEKGVLINFYLFQNKLKFEINEVASKKSGLNVSFHLLKLARIVSPSNK